MSYESFQKAYALEQLPKYIHPADMEIARAAFHGDAEAAFILSCSLESNMLGVVAVSMWRCKVPKEAFGAYLRSVWGHDHREVIWAADSRRTLAYMFRYAAFPLPAELPDVVKVWRGTSCIPIGKDKTDYAWTTDRDLACWFAMRFADDNGSPLVLTADVAKSDIALFTNDRSESEAVLMRPPAARIDGDVSDWTTCYQRKQAALDRDRKTTLNNASAVTD